MMWMVVMREPVPDAPYWHGRRTLALVDAVLWPGLGALLLWHIPVLKTVVGSVALWMLLLWGLSRMSRAWWANGRYHFTTLRLLKLAAMLMLLGAIFKFVMVVAP